MRKILISESGGLHFWKVFYHRNTWDGRPVSGNKGNIEWECT